MYIVHADAMLSNKVHLHAALLLLLFGSAGGVGSL